MTGVPGVVFSMSKKMPKALNCKHGPENTFHLASPLGELELTCCPKGVHALSLPLICDKDFNPIPQHPVEITHQLYQDNGYTYKSALLCVQWLQAYFHNISDIQTTERPPICVLKGKSSSLTNSSFTERVWRTLADNIPPGCTVSYGDLAVKSGSTTAASRAVGQAMRNNPVMIIVPCHRVILSSGALGNYSRGTKNSVKAWLLKHEGMR